MTVGSFSIHCIWLEHVLYISMKDEIRRLDKNLL